MKYVRALAAYIVAVKATLANWITNIVNSLTGAALKLYNGLL